AAVPPGAEVLQRPDQNRRVIPPIEVRQQMPLRYGEPRWNLLSIEPASHNTLHHDQTRNTPHRDAQWQFLRQGVAPATIRNPLSAWIRRGCMVASATVYCKHQDPAA